jgi:hypothetical protein
MIVELTIADEPRTWADLGLAVLVSLMTPPPGAARAGA